MKRFKIYATLVAVLALAAAISLKWKSAKDFPPPVVPPAAAAQPITPKLAAPPHVAATPPQTQPVPASDVTVLSPQFFPVLQEFSAWADHFSSSNALDVAEGEALAHKRRTIMLHLIKTDPEKALAWTVPARWRSELPASVTQYFEQRVDGRGALNVAVATDFEAQTSKVLRDVRIGDKTYVAWVYRRRLSQVSQLSIPIHGIALDGQLAVHVDPVRALEPEEVVAASRAGAIVREQICGVSGRPSNYRNQEISADIGGEIVHFCGVDHLRLVNEQLTAAEGNNDTAPGGNTGPGVVGWTQGPKTLLYMRVNFPDDLTEPITEANAYATMNSVNAFYTESSYNTTSLTPTVTPLLTLPQTKWWYATAGAGSLLDDARAISRAAGYDTSNYDWDIVTFTSVPGYDFGGLAYVRGKGVWLQSPGVGVTSHEIGHNYGLWHANFWDTSGTNGDSIIGPGTHVEYGNVYDTMGRASAGNNQFNAMHKNRLDWLPTSYVHDVTSNGVYRIFAFDVPNRDDGHFLAAKIKKDFQRNYWVEFRQKFKSNPWLQNGVLLNWSPWANSSGGTHLLDTTPGTPTGDDSKEDAAVVIGRTYTDAPAGVHITPLARGLTGTNVWIDVQVNLGAFPTNQPPVLAIEMDPSNAPPGTLIHFHATASDPDGDTLAYAWSFDDLSFSTNNLPWISQRWNSLGEHVVRCVVSDMKGGVASANGVVTIGSPLGYRISGRVTDTNGLPLEGVLVANGMTNVPYFGGYTDSNGRYIIVDAVGDVILSAVKYGYTNSPVNSASNTISASVADADFSTLALTTVSIVASTNAVLENNTAVQSFTVTRTGDTTTNLIVNLYLSGTATLGSDYTLSPGQAGANTIDIPPGATQMQISFQTINDAIVEGPETVSLTVLEDTNYVNSSLSEAIITILDDDVAPLPKVTVAARTSSGDNTAIESDPNGGVFTFTRTGGTQSDLTVNYSVSGTATPGIDYQALLGVVIIPAGSSSANVPFRIIDDMLVESNETVNVTVSLNAAYTASANVSTITIVDDDSTTVTIYPTGTAAEPSSSGRFTVMRAGDMTDNLVVSYTVSGTATSGADYLPLSGSVTIPAGFSSADIRVTPVADTLLEGDESVIISLASNTNYGVGIPGTATISILDQQKASVSIIASDSTASEPGSDTGEFTISRGSVVNGDLTVNLAISGTALNGIDYVPLDNFLVIPDGASSVKLDVIAFDDLHQESNETVIVTLVTSGNYNIGSPRNATVTIEDDDSSRVPAIGFTYAASSVVESQSPGVSITLSATSAVPVTVECRIIGGTAPASRYTLPQASITFDPGELAKSLPLTIVNDAIVQPNQTIRLALFNPNSAATLDGIKVHTYTILDDDTNTISIAATVPIASETGPIPGNFRFSRNGGTNAQIVNFQVTGTASSPTDYLPIGNSVTIPAGATFVDVPVMPANDPTVELSETVVVTLTSAPGANLISPRIATVIITDNDTNTLPIVSINSTNKPYAIEGSATNGEFVLTRSGPTTSALAVSFSISGTASNGFDYVRLTNVVTIPIGQSSLTVPVVAIDDTLVEGEESVIVTLTDNSTYQVQNPACATVIIQDNDQSVRLDASDFIASKLGPDPGEFTFTRAGTTNTDLTVFYALSGTASNGVDFMAITNFIVIPATQLSNTLVIHPLITYVPRGPLTVTLTLLGNAAYSLSSPTNATVIINDNMPMVTMTGTLTNASENGEQPGLITLTRGGDTNMDFTAFVKIGGTATYGVDYPPFATNVLFCCGVTTIKLFIYPTNDLFIEGTETVTAALVPSPATYTIIGGSNTLITIDDVGTNEFPVVSITSPVVKTVFLTMTGTNSTNVNMILSATVTDDGVVNPTPTLTWTNLSGLDTYAFSDTNAANTTVSFFTNGVYQLQLTADDGQLRTRTNITVVVNQATTLAPDLLYWKLDDGSGTNALDASLAGRNGQLVGTTNWATNGIAGGALGFGGTNDLVREASGLPFLNSLKALTVSLWIKSATTNSDRGFISADDSGGTNTTLGFRQETFDARSHATNAIEVTIPTTGGVTRYVSSSNVTTNDWQNLVLTWSNGIAPALFINGRTNLPTFPSLEIAGKLTNCLQFIAGKGPLGGSNSWNGLLDDVRLYSRALNGGEAAALAALPMANFAPFVDAGPDFTVQLGFLVPLVGVVTDDGKPNPPGALSNAWSYISGPDVITFTNASSLTNTVVFATAGTYVFRLTSTDGDVQVYDEVTVTVIEPTSISIDATDGDAAELGPDPGQFTVSRVGDSTIDLTVYLSFTGTASNGVDFLRLTNIVTIPAGSNAITLDVIPFLDNRTEGDETVILSAVSNVAYTIVSGPATVTIHDSPYGVWTIANFTLEELTLPNLSGETADFDRDGLMNFGEYALNRNPKVAETNAPVPMTIELNPADGKKHITLWYQRRLLPTDVRYGVFVSNDLRNWNTGTNYIEELSVTDDGNGITETVTNRLVAPYLTTTNQFIDLRVWRPVQ